MAKKSSKKNVAKKSDVTKTVKTTASTVINEVEKAGELVIGEVKDGVGAVTDRISAAAKTVAETQAAQVLKSLIEEVETIGSELIDAVGHKLDQLRGKVADETASSKKTTAKKKATTKKKAGAKKKTAVAKKKAAPKKKAGTKKKVATKKKASTKKKVAAKKKATTKKKSSAKS
jgi:hypothetical protein